VRVFLDAHTVMPSDITMKTMKKTIAVTFGPPRDVI
jgi:hypothetical protein